jgi:hypothetical protein
MSGSIPPIVLELEGRDSKALSALGRVREEMQRVGASVERLSAQLTEAAAVNERYAATLSAAGAAGRRAGEGTTAMAAGARRATQDTAALGERTRVTGQAAQGLSAQARTAGQEAERFGRRARLAGEQTELLANRARLAAAEAARLGEQAALGGEGSAALARQARTASAEAERLGNRARLAGEQAQWLSTRAATAGREAGRLGAQAQVASVQTTRLGESAARTSTTLGVMGAEARHAAGGAGVLSGGVLRVGSSFTGAAEGGSRLVNTLRKTGPVFAAVAAGVSVVSVKLAADFQTQMVRMRTSAGETGDIVNGRLTGNLALVSAGIKKIAVKTATPLAELATGMYRIESAGFHGANGLKILTAAAEGARSEGADLDTVANTLDSTMNAFGFSTKNVNGVMNAMVATVSHGKATMQELAGALPVVTAKASAAGLSLQEMLGAMATMTSQGVSARQSAQNLQFTIGALQGPSSVARNAMNSIGLDSLKLSKNLGKNGLTGTFATLSKAITDHMGKDGLVVVKTMNDSAVATASAQKMLQGMTGDTKRLAESYYSGSISLGAYKKAVKDLPSDQANLAMQFKGTADQANGFNTMLKNGSGPQKTYSDMIRKMTGGQAGLNTFLQLSGIHAGTFVDNVKLIGKAAKDNSAHVEGFAQVQKTFNFQMAKVKEIAVTAATSLGEKFLPILEKVFGFFEHHKTLAKVLAVAIGGIVVALGAASVAMLAFEVAASPVGIVALAVVGLGVAFYELWQHSVKARNIMTDVFVVLGLAGLQYAKTQLEALKWVSKAFLTYVSFMVGVSAKAFGWVPGVGGKLKKAQKAVAEFRDDTSKAFDTMLGKIDDWNKALLTLPRKVELKGDITDLNKKIADAKKQLDKKNLPESKRVVLNANIDNWQMQVLKAKTALAETPEKKTAVLTAQIGDWQKKISQAKALMADKNLPPRKKATLTADIADLQRKVAQAKTMIRSVQGKSVVVSINTVKTTVNKEQYYSQGPHKGAATGTIMSGGVRKMAAGGFGRPAMMARGGTNVLWAEGPDESYIPHTRNARSRRIAEDTVGILGGSVAWRGAGKGASLAASTAPLGAQVAKGLWAGMDGQAAWLSAQAAKFATATIPVPMADALGIRSPSRVAMTLGRWVGAGMVQGLTGSTASVKSATLRLTHSIEQVFHDDAARQLATDKKELANLAGVKGKKAASKRADLRSDIRQQQTYLHRDSAVSRFVARDNAKLLKLAAQRDGVSAKLKAAQSKLTALQKSWTDERNSVAQGVMEGASVITASPNPGRSLNANDIIAQMRTQVQAATQFAATLRQLQKRGLRSDLLQQLATAGVDQAGATALALAGSSKSQIKAVNQMQATLSTAANGAGAAVADSMYAAGIRSAQGLVKGLKSQEKAIDAEMLRIAKSMQAAIKKELKIRSPSGVMAALGDHTAMGMAVGINRSSKHAVIAARGMAMAVRQGATITGAAGRGGGHTTITNVYVTVEGTVTAERDLVTAIETRLTRVAKNNPGRGFQPANPWNSRG